MLRATQFHSLVDGVFTALGRLPLLMPLPAGFALQSVHAAEVAERLVAAAVAGPRGRLPDLGGPEVLSVAEAAEQWKHARGVRRHTVQLPLPGGTAVAFRSGHHLVTDGDHGQTTWREWLQANGSRGHD